MKKFISTFLIIVVGCTLPAQELVPVDNGSTIKFTIKNFFSNVDGNFTGLNGSIRFNATNPAASVINVKVAASTVNTGNGSRDSHLRKEEYFDVAKYPVLNFVSNRISATSTPSRFMAEGKITIKGITKLISFPFTVVPRGDGFLFEGSFKLNRRDFNVGGNSMVLSDNLTVSLSIITKKPTR